MKSISVYHAQELPTSDAKHVDAISSRYNEDVFCGKDIILHSPDDGFTIRVFGILPVSMCKYLFLLECANEQIHGRYGYVFHIPWYLIL